MKLVAAASLFITVTASLAAQQQSPRIVAGPPAPGREVVFATVSRMSASAIAMDTLGNTYLTGMTSAIDFQTTPGAFKRGCDRVVSGQCLSDAVVVKLDPFGRLVYATRLGGSSNETGNAIAVDVDGNAYVAGTSWSEDFPLRNALTAPRASQQGFLAKLSPGGALLFSTPVPGEGLTAVAVDDGGAIAIAGFAYHESSPLVRPFQPTIHSTFAASPDAFVAKLVGDPPQYVFSTYLGGSGSDTAQGIALFGGRVYVVGSTSSGDFPLVNPTRSFFGGPASTDAFAAALSMDGQMLEFSTVLGGGGLDGGRAIAVDRDGTAYVTGVTLSVDFPTTTGVLDHTCGTDGRCNPTQRCDLRGCSTLPFYDAFVAAFDRTGSLRASTYVGGDAGDEGRGIIIDAGGRIEIAGFSTSPAVAGLTPLAGCDTPETCSAFVAELSPGLEAMSGFRSSVSAIYTPGFEYVGFAKTAIGQRALLVNDRGGAVIIRVDSK